MDQSIAREVRHSRDFESTEPNRSQDRAMPEPVRPRISFGSVEHVSVVNPNHGAPREHRCHVAKAQNRRTRICERQAELLAESSREPATGRTSRRLGDPRKVDAGRCGEPQPQFRFGLIDLFDQRAQQLAADTRNTAMRLRQKTTVDQCRRCNTPRWYHSFGRQAKKRRFYRGFRTLSLRPVGSASDNITLGNGHRRCQSRWTRKSRHRGCRSAKSPNVTRTWRGGCHHAERRGARQHRHGQRGPGSTGPVKDRRSAANRHARNPGKAVSPSKQ